MGFYLQNGWGSLGGHEHHGRFMSNRRNKHPFNRQVWSSHWILPGELSFQGFPVFRSQQNAVLRYRRSFFTFSQQILNACMGALTLFEGISHDNNSDSLWALLRKYGGIGTRYRKKDSLPEVQRCGGGSKRR